MNILIMTNTYKPFTGGVEQSVVSFTEEYRRLGHRVMIVAPTYENMGPDEEGVVRLPAFKHFNHSGFSATLPIHPYLGAAVKEFGAEIIHSQHPFMIGYTAFRLSVKFQIPLVFTHHTYYEQYTHYMPLDSAVLKKFVKALSVAYSNLCHQVFAPSLSLETELRKRGVISPIDVVPTGIDVERFSTGDGNSIRQKLGIPQEGHVVGFVSRLAPEKNLEFLTKAVLQFLHMERTAHFLMVGLGPSKETVVDFFERENVSERVHLLGSLEGRELADAYHAMDVFAFTSQSETQGLVLAEAMAAGIPVVAVDAPGVREMVYDYVNGRLLQSENVQEFADALREVCEYKARPEGSIMAARARETAKDFALHPCAMRALEIYRTVIGRRLIDKKNYGGYWTLIKRAIIAEWEITKILAKSTRHAFRTESVKI